MAPPFVPDESLKNSAPGLFHFAGKPGQLSPVLFYPLLVLVFFLIALAFVTVASMVGR